MPGVAKSEMDVDAFLAWAEGREGRWELRDGQPVLMAPERAGHALTKYAAQESLKAEMTGKTAAEVKAKAIAGLAEVGQLLDAKASTDAPGVKAWLKHIAEKVAGASSEGGFLGFGGVKVSDAEKATLAEVAAALKIAA